MNSNFVKRWIKYILIASGFLALLSLVLITTALIICDDDDYRKLAVWVVERVAGYRMAVDGKFAVGISTQPSLTVERIRFEPLEGGPSPQLKSVGQFHLKIALKHLLLGSLVVKRLQIADVTIADNNFQGDKRYKYQLPGIWSNIDLPIFESVSLNNIKISDASRNMRFQMKGLTLDDVDDAGPIIVKGNGSINGQEFRIDGQLGALKEALSRSQPYPLNLNFKFADLILSASGTIADDEGGENLNLQFVSDIKDIQSLLRLMKVDFQLAGELKFKATLTGDIGALRVTNLKLFVADEPSLTLSAEGVVQDLRSGRGTDISLSVECRNQDLLGRLFPDDWETIEEFSFKGALRKIANGFRIEDVAARIVNNKGINLKTNGWLHMGDMGDWNDGISLKSVDLNLHLTSPQTESIRPLLTNAIPEIGSVDARARLTGPIERLALEDLHIIRGGTGPVRVETHGRIGWIPLGADERTSDMDFTMTVMAEQSLILSTFYGVPIKEIGTTTITGRVIGATDQFQLKNIVFHSKDENGLETHMFGGIDFAEQADGKLLGDVRFDLEIYAPNMGAAEPLLGTNVVPTLGPVSARGTVLGSTDVVSIEDVKISAGKPDKLHIKWQGRVGQFPLGGDRPIEEVQTFGSMQAARFSDFAALFGIKMPDIGPVFASWGETDRDGTYGMKDLKLSAGDGKRFKLTARGNIDSIVQGYKAKLDGVNLQLNLKASDTHNISQLMGIRLPNLGAIDGRFTLTGGQQKLMATNLQLIVKSAQGMKIDGTGGVGYIGVAKDLPVRDIDIKLTAIAPNISALPVARDWGLPELGPLEASARVRGQDSALVVDILDLRAGPQHGPLVQLQGTLNNIGPGQPMRLTGSFQADSRPWVEKLIQRDASDSPHFDGAFTLSEDQKVVRIDQFDLSTTDKGGLSILANGSIESVSDAPDFNLQVLSKAADPAQWGELFGISLPQLHPLTFNGRYSSLEQEHRLEGELRLGKTRFQTYIRQPTGQLRFQLEARASSPSVYLEDIGMPPGEPEKTAPQKQAAASKGPFFDNRPLPVESLQSGDFSLNLQADRVVGPNAAVGPVDIDITLKNGRLRLTTSDVGYQHGQLSLDSVIDTSGLEPQFSLKLSAEDVDIDDTLAYLGKPLHVEGQLNLTADIKSHGRTSKEMAVNLSGEFGVAVENGRIQRGVEMIASDALDLLLTAPAKDMYTDLNCMAGQLVFDDGNGTIQVLYLDTPGVRAKGGGSINLGAETLDILIKPESKRRFIRPSSPVRIKGPLGDPSVTKIPANEAAILAGQLAVPIIALPARALGLLWSVINEDKDENSPCLTGLVQKPD